MLLICFLPLLPFLIIVSQKCIRPAVADVSCKAADDKRLVQIIHDRAKDIDAQSVEIMAALLERPHKSSEDGISDFDFTGSVSGLKALAAIALDCYALVRNEFRFVKLIEPGNGAQAEALRRAKKGYLALHSISQYLADYRDACPQLVAATGSTSNGDRLASTRWHSPKLYQCMTIIRKIASNTEQRSS